MEVHLRQRMLENMEAGPSSQCGKVSGIFVKEFAQQLMKRAKTTNEEMKKDGS